MKAIPSAIAAAGLMAASIATSAAPTVTALGGDQYRIAFDPLTFNITTAGDVAAIVFEDFYAAAQPSCGTYLSGTVEARLNGGAAVALDGSTCTGAFDFLNDVDGDDLLVTISSGFQASFGSVAVGDTLWLSNAVNYVFRKPGFDPTAASGPFDAFLVNNDFVRVSDIQGTNRVPEPGAAWLAALGLLGAGQRRRRRRR